MILCLILPEPGFKFIHVNILLSHQCAVVFLVVDVLLFVCLFVFLLLCVCVCVNDEPECKFLCTETIKLYCISVSFFYSKPSLLST